MEDNYKRLLSTLPVIKPPANLESHILTAVKTISRHRKRQLTFVSRFAFVASMIALFLSSIWVYQDMVHSGFIQSFSLFISDSSAIFNYWRDFLFMLVEAMPFVSLAVCLAALGSVITSLRLLFKSKIYLDKVYVIS